MNLEERDRFSLEIKLQRYLDACIDDARGLLAQHADSLTRGRVMRMIVRTYDLVRGVIEDNAGYENYLESRQEMINDLGGNI